MEAVFVSRRLVALLESHRIEYAIHGEWVALAGRLSAIRTTWYAGEETGRLDVDVLLEGERQSQETFAGIGNDEGGLRDALRNFVPNLSHVLLSVFWGQAEEDQVMVETWEVDERHFEVHIGSLGLRGAEGKAPPLLAGLFPSIKRAIRAESLDACLHWSRHFFRTFGSQRMVKTLSDNQSWEAGIQNLAALDWQDSQGYCSVRNFLILKPLAQAAASHNPQGVDGDSIPIRSPFNEFDPYHTTSTAMILRPLADGTIRVSFFIGKWRRDFQTRYAQD